MAKISVLFFSFIIAVKLIWLCPEVNASDSMDEQIKGMAVSEKVSHLSGSIWRSTLAGKSDESEEAMRLIREIDGHAKILADIFELKRGQRDYELRRLKFFKILAQIGSENTVDVLIRYLDDTGDAYTLEELSKETDVALVGSNATLAAQVLDELNIPGAPENKKFGSYTEDEVELWREWAEARQKGQYIAQKHPSIDQKGGNLKVEVKKLPGEYALFGVALILISIVCVRRFKKAGNLE